MKQVETYSLKKVKGRWRIDRQTTGDGEDDRETGTDKTILLNKGLTPHGVGLLCFMRLRYVPGYEACFGPDGEWG